MMFWVFDTAFWLGLACLICEYGIEPHSEFLAGLVILICLGGWIVTSILSFVFMAVSSANYEKQHGFGKYVTSTRIETPRPYDWKVNGQYFQPPSYKVRSSVWTPGPTRPLGEQQDARNVLGILAILAILGLMGIGIIILL